MYDKLVIKLVTPRHDIKTQYDSDEQGLQKNIEDFDKKILNTSGLVKILTTTQKLQWLIKKIPSELDYLPQIPDITNLAIKSDLNKKAAEFESKILTLLIWLPKLL